MKNRIWICIVLVILAFSLTACGNKVENAVTPMNSVTEQVSEPGIHAYASSLKTHYKNASKEGDMGSYQFTLMTDSTPAFFQAPWWVDDWKERLTADIVIIAGNTGTSYSGFIECHKCGYSEAVEGVIGDNSFSKTFACSCDGKSNRTGMEKHLTLTIIPIA